MNVVSKKRLVEFWTVHPQAKAPLAAWYKIVKSVEWRSPQDIKDQFRSADCVADNRVVFNIKGNDYRLVVRVSFTHKQVLVKFVGTHVAYDKIDVRSI